MTGKPIVTDVQLECVEANPFQVRLAEDPEHVTKVALSIAHSDLLQNPVGRQVGNHVQLAFGHTRLAAYRQLRDEDIAAGGDGGKWREIPVDVRELTDLELFELAIRENIDRKDLTPIEEARAMSTYREVFGKTSSQIGELFGLSDSAVRNRMRLLELPRPVQESVDSGGITENTARKLLTVQKVAPKQVEELAEKLVKGGYHDPEAIDFELDGVMEESGHTLCHEGGGLDPDTGKAIPSALDGAVPGIFGVARLDSGERKLLTPPGKKSHHKKDKPARDLLVCNLCGRGAFKGEGAVKIHMNYKHKEPSTPAPADPEVQANAVPDPKADLAAFAQVVGDERRAAQLTQREMANLLGVYSDGGQVVWRWEHALSDGRRAILRACFEGTLAGAALAQRILKQVYP